MRVQVLFFGVLKDVVGRASESVELREPATVADVLEHYQPRVPGLRKLLPAVALSVNQHYAGPGTVLGANDEIAFEGIVRNHTRGRQTLYLDYEAYEGMALKQMEELAEQALRQFPVREVAIVHRLGRLEIGEISVLIVVASAHRAAAYEASRWLIDTLKRSVPIWKKEYFVDGAVWAEGEPFPDEIPRAQGSPTGQAASK